MPDSISVRNGAVASDEQIRNVLRRHIRRALDTREFNRETLARESGVNIHQIDQIMSRDESKHRRVACEDALCLAYALGTEAVSALIGTIHHTAQHMDEALALAPMAMAATALEGVSVLVTAAADGRIDHTEVPLCREAADKIIAAVTPLSSAGTMQ